MRTPDSQYRDRIKFILEKGVLIKDTPQGKDVEGGLGALTCFGTLAPMAFDLSNGAPIITDRSIKGFWRKPIIEIIEFAHGTRSIQALINAGCNYWKDYVGKGVKHGLEADDLGPGSYGAAFHDFPMPDGSTLNQYQQQIDQIKARPDLRTLFISPWIPFYTARGSNRKVVVAPCHGWQQFRVIEGKLHLLMFQRSADFPIGVPSNMAQYAAILLMMARATGYQPGIFVHQFGDAHIYEDQIDHMRELVKREALPLPTLRLAKERSDFFSITADDFTLEDYYPHPSMPGIPFKA